MLKTNQIRRIISQLPLLHKVEKWEVSGKDLLHIFTFGDVY
ncbi:hypothetical protein VB711_18455 [Cronbergia sp. UHCC 0137]|nr:hypothetical protein [Cronbergia sp. UHCC 0137]MEA5619809.1 hypothetical protein [Cronbergia sp. UHCC 0137]